MLMPAASSAAGPLRYFDLDESPGAPPVVDQLQLALKKVMGKVLSLFESWDVNADGVVGRAEFHRAMHALGLEVPAEAIDQLFDSWQRAGIAKPGEDDVLDLRELTAVLRRPPLLTQLRKHVRSTLVEQEYDLAKGLQPIFTGMDAKCVWWPLSLTDSTPSPRTH